MIFNVTGGGGGSAGLNFSVVAYKTEEELLAATPAENTIGLITTTPIISWIFSATEPNPATPGMVWILTDRSSGVEFNALKKNGIQVYPISAKQYISGSWVDKTAKSYQGGEWVNWAVFLYNAGNEYESITGGWQARAWSGTVNHTPKIPTITKDDGGITISCNNTASDQAFSGVVETIKDIDLTNRSKIIVHVKNFYVSKASGAYDAMFWVAAVKRNATYCFTDAAAVTQKKYTTNGNFTVGYVVVDVSSLSDLSESYDIVIALRTQPDRQSSLTFDEVWIE